MARMLVHEMPTRSIVQSLSFSGESQAAIHGILSHNLDIENQKQSTGISSVVILTTENLNTAGFGRLCCGGMQNFVNSLQTGLPKPIQMRTPELGISWALNRRQDQINMYC